MDSNDVFLSVVAVLVIWWMWRANHPKKAQPQKPEAEGMTFTKGPGKAATPSEPFLEAIEAEHNQATQAARDASAAYARSVEDRIGDDLALKSRLAKFAKDNQLDIALLELWEEMEHYPSWCKRPDWPMWNKLSITNPTEEVVDFRNKTIHFSYLETRYSIVMGRWDGMDSDTYEDYRLLENGEEMFAVSCRVHYDVHFTRRNPSDIKAFKKRGNWASMLVQLHAKKRLESDKASADLRARMAADIRDRFEE